MLQIEKVIEFLKKFERMIIICLIAMMVIVVSVATFELGWIIFDLKMDGYDGLKAAITAIKSEGEHHVY